MSCVICLTNNSNYIVIPCGHICLCEECSSHTYQTCPMCRGIVERIIKTFNVNIENTDDEINNIEQDRLSAKSKKDKLEQEKQKLEQDLEDVNKIKKDIEHLKQNIQYNNLVNSEIRSDVEQVINKNNFINDPVKNIKNNPITKFFNKIFSSETKIKQIKPLDDFAISKNLSKNFIADAKPLYHSEIMASQERMKKSHFEQSHGTQSIQKHKFSNECNKKYIPITKSASCCRRELKRGSKRGSGCNKSKKRGSGCNKSKKRGSSKEKRFRKKSKCGKKIY